jgi:hypothetical protein
MTDPERTATRPPRNVQGDLAALAGAVERLAADLAIGEEPSGFAVALEQGAGD